MMKNRYRWIFGGLLLLSGLPAPMAGFAEGEPALHTRKYIMGPVFISTSDTRGTAIRLLPHGQSIAWSLHEHATTPITMTDQSLSLYQYSHDESRGQTTINVLGGEPVSFFQSTRRLSENFRNPFPPYNYLADYPPGTNSLTEAVLIIGARVVLGTLFHQLRVEQASLPWLTF